MKRPDVFTELEAAAVGCIALEGTCIRSAYVHDLYVLICDYKGVTVYVVVPDSFNRYAVLRRVLGHQLRFIPTAVSAADGTLLTCCSRHHRMADDGDIPRDYLHELAEASPRWD